MYWRMRNVRPPIYESGGQEFESLRARHFRFHIKHLRGSFRARKSAQQIGRVYVAFFAVRVILRAGSGAAFNGETEISLRW
jgi:hypothetical protein